MLNRNFSLLFFFFSFLFISSCSDTSENDVYVDHKYCENIQRNNAIRLSTELEPFDSLMKSKTGVYVLEDGGGSLITRAWLTEYAEKSIDIQYFIFSTDNVGLLACDYLVRAADRGVKVRIIVDDIMVDADFEDILTMDSHENITIKIYNPGVNLGKSIVSKIKKFAVDFRSANQRMHNKTFIVDGKVAITGGRNIADEYFDYDHEYNFRDRDVLLLGKISNEFNRSFSEFWESELSVTCDEVLEEEFTISSDDPFYRLHEYACNPENFWPQIRDQIDNYHLQLRELEELNKITWLDSVEFISDVPGKNDGNSGLGGGGITTSALISLINNANNSIDIQTPYLITSDLGKGLFRDAVSRGVKVRILTNSLASTDNVEAFSSYQSDREELLNTGVEIYEFKPDAEERMKLLTGALQKDLNFTPIFGLHAKSMVVDDTITVIGTFNLDPRSANLNTECIAVIHSPDVARGVLNGMEEEYKEENSWHITLDFNPDSEVSKLKRVNTWTRKILPKDIL